MYTYLSITELDYCLFPDTSVRLIDGINKLEGRVEIMYQGIWGTICDDEWDDIDATVLCRELGYYNGTATRADQFGSGSGPVWLRQVGCFGNESKLSHCIHAGAGNTGNCSHTQDVGVQCRSHGNCSHMYIRSYYSE